MKTANKMVITITPTLKPSRCDRDHHLVCRLHPPLLDPDGLHRKLHRLPPLLRLALRLPPQTSETRDGVGHHVLGHLHHLPWLCLRYCWHVLLRHCSTQSVSIGNPSLITLLCIPVLQAFRQTFPSGSCPISASISDHCCQQQTHISLELMSNLCFVHKFVNSQLRNQN